MRTEKKKSPNDYPLFSIRIDADKKTDIEEMIEKVRVRMNRKVGPHEKKFKKNSIAVAALERGLRQMLERKT